jgi:hypothetical protein
MDGEGFGEDMARFFSFYRWCFLKSLIHGFFPTDETQGFS